MHRDTKSDGDIPTSFYTIRLVGDNNRISLARYNGSCVLVFLSLGYRVMNDRCPFVIYYRFLSYSFEINTGR